MSFQDIIDFFASILAGLVDFYGWVERSGYTVATNWWTLVKALIDDWIWKLRLFFDRLYLTIYSLGTSLWEAVFWLFTDRIQALLYIIRDKYTTLSHLIYTFGQWVGTWADTWFRRIDYLVSGWWETIETVFEFHPEKLLYLVTTGWLKYCWYVIDRWEDLFGIVEEHLEGWRTFVDDPAQALWDWVEPRLQELTAAFLVKVW